MKQLKGGVTVYVPQRWFDTKRFEHHLDQLVSEVGGYTASDVMGGWRGADGRVQNEEVVCVEVLSHADNVAAAGRRIAKIILYLLQQGEEAVLVRQVQATGGPYGAIYYQSDKADLIRQAEAPDVHNTI